MKAEFLTLGEVATILRISNATVYRLIHHLQLPAMKVGNKWRVKTDQFEAWIHRNHYNYYN